MMSELAKNTDYVTNALRDRVVFTLSWADADNDMRERCLQIFICYQHNRPNQFFYRIHFDGIKTFEFDAWKQDFTKGVMSSDIAIDFSNKILKTMENEYPETPQIWDDNMSTELLKRCVTGFVSDYIHYQ